MAGWFPLFASSSGLAQNKRTGVNFNGPNVFEYAFIDHFRQADGDYSPNGRNFNTDPTYLFHQNVDSNGYLTSAAAQALGAGSGPRVPSPVDFAGPYVLRVKGSNNCRMSLTNYFDATTFTEVSPSGYTRLSNGFWQIPDNVSTRIVFNMSNAATRPQLLNFMCSEGILLEKALYRLEDEADFNAGKLFRAGFKQIWIDFNPSYIRFMDFCNVNDGMMVRWRDRARLSDAAWAANFGALRQPKYGITGGTNNKLTLASVSGMPVSMTHGEIVTCRIGATVQRAILPGDVTENGQIPIAGINKATGVFNVIGHPFATGDLIIHRMTDGTQTQTPTGMLALNQLPVKITKIDADHYSAVTYPGNAAIDMTGYPDFTHGVAQQYILLDVGGRGEYPVLLNDAERSITAFGPKWLEQGKYKSFVFHKTIVAVPGITGCWLASRSAGSDDTAMLRTGYPPEVPLAFMNEIMAQIDALGLSATKGPIDCWMNMPDMGMIAEDADYNAADNWPVNLAKCFLETTTTERDGSVAKLDSRCKLIVEHSNETWNRGFDHGCRMSVSGRQKWPASGYGDMSNYSTYRAVKSVMPIQAAYPGHPQLKYAMGAFGTYGYSGDNVTRIDGNSYVNGVDGLNSANKPMFYFDYISPATYVYNQEANPAYGYGAARADWDAAGSNTTLKNAAIQKYVTGIVSQGGQEGLNYYLGKIDEFITGVAPQGKDVALYEGGWDLYIGSDVFLRAVKESQIWADAWKSFQASLAARSRVYYPADFIMVDDRWGHTARDTYKAGVEGAGLDLAWVGMANRNNGI
jgi:hypothetical protein